MKTAILATALVLLMPNAHAGMKAICSHADQTRVIEVVYSGEGTVPCEVHYTKQKGTQVLWSAQSVIGYCEQKAEAFIEKQRGWGWDCDVSRMGDEMMPMPEPAMDQSAMDEQVMEEPTMSEAYDSEPETTASEPAMTAPAAE